MNYPFILRLYAFLNKMNETKQRFKLSQRPWQNWMKYNAEALEAEWQGISAEEWGVSYYLKHKCVRQLLQGQPVTCVCACVSARVMLWGVNDWLSYYSMHRAMQWSDFEDTIFHFAALCSAVIDHKMMDGDKLLSLHIDQWDSGEIEPKKKTERK